MNNTRPLRTALLANAVFSVTCGLLLLAWPSLIEGLLGIQAPLILPLVGLGLLLFAIDLLHQATRPRLATWRALYACAGDFLWVLGSVLGLLLFHRLLSATGTATLLTVALIVLTFGIWQLWGIDRTHRAEDSALYRHCLVVRTKAPATDMWDVIGRMGDIQNYTSSLVRSEMLDGKSPGVGAVRRCTDRAGRRWAEECIDFEVGHSFTVRFVSEAPNFPFPVSTMVGGWEVISAGTGSDVMVWWELAPKPRFLSPILLPILAFSADRDLVQIIQRMAEDALGQNDIPKNSQQAKRYSF
ncbi:SRPBCC family protein [Romeria aff. gracilis LEGE 07310]|uniref:SRPBCC family protein n=1 Tax=Vasconcelosia minhoensis LEGE 07310 TaxID=915328 RepID=A0A8J7DA36_9CYAN|nr:SRPBCC family protein [Romeria gracilis]MBE9075997.1 SRPBCC family protein [Romeria aff. gracilis LEGE 07310]